MIIIQQAIFGDKAGGYALLRSSFDDNSIPKRIGNSTDVLDRPVGEVLGEPIVRGFSIDDYYLIVKSFSLVGEKIRRGRVFSHALFIRQSDVEKICDLRSLLDLLMVEIDLDAATTPIHFEDRVMSIGSTAPVKGRAAYGVKGLLNHGEFSDTLAWVGKAGYFEFLCQIWAAIPKQLRKEIFFGAAFDPSKVEGGALKIVQFDSELAFKWKKTDFLVVEESSEAELTRESEFYLAGDRIRASSLESMIEKFQLRCDQVSDLAVLDKVVATFQKLGSDVALGELIVFAELVSKYNPNPHLAANEKKELLSKITRRMEPAIAKEIQALRHLDWKGFPIPEITLGDALQDWGRRAVADGSNNKEVPKVIASAFLESKGKEGWWHTSIRAGVISALKKWAGNHARVIWRWIQTEPLLVALLDEIAKQGIPKEADLIEQLLDLKESTAQEVVAISKAMKWLQLHGKLLVQILPIEQALNRQLEIDTDSNHFPALRLMAKAASAKEFVQCSVKVGDKRLLEISGELVAINPSLLENLEVKNPNWREVWLKGILKGVQPLEGVSDPKRSLIELLDLLIASHEVNSQLIDSFANTSLSDLSDFHGRKEVWKVLPARSRDQYLTATARACVVGFDQGTIQLAAIEKPLLDKLADEVFFRTIANDKKVQIASKLALFQHVPNIGARHLLIVLEHNHLDSVEATKVGNLVWGKRWVNVARDLLKMVSYRKDLAAALSICYPLLDFIERIEVKFFGYSNVSVSLEDWYSALAAICAELLERGPSQNGIWEACGGKNGDLLSNSTGKQTWIHALNEIKKGKTEIKIRKLLSELQKEFPKSEKLKMLEQVRPK